MPFLCFKVFKPSNIITVDPCLWQDLDDDGLPADSEGKRGEKRKKSELENLEGMLGADGDEDTSVRQAKKKHKYIQQGSDNEQQGREPMVRGEKCKKKKKFPSSNSR